MFSSFSNLPPFVQKVNNAIHWVNHYPLDSAIDFTTTCPRDSDISGGQRYPSFEQLVLVLKGSLRNDDGYSNDKAKMQ